MSGQAGAPGASGAGYSDPGDSDPEYPDHSAALAALVGSPTGPPQLSASAVNTAMIRHWVEAMGDRDPVYVSDEAARAEGLPGIIAPPTMLQAWIMRGLRAQLAAEAARADGGRTPGTAHDLMMALFDEEGLTSVVATNCEQTYHRPLAVGDRVIVASVIESITDVKTTGLGTGRFATTRMDFVAVADEKVGERPDVTELAVSGEPVGTMRFRILKFRPAPKVEAPAPTRPRRPRPAITHDNAFFFEGARQGKLLIQKCSSCGRLRHPPLPACAACRSFEWTTVESTGRGSLFSFVVVHHPQVPAFDYPLAIGLIELEEGTRLVANLEVPDTSLLEVGMPVEAAMEVFDDELSLPVFRPAPATGGR